MEKNPGFYVKENFLDIVYDKAQKALAQDAIKRETFANLYDPEQINKDNELVKKLEERFSQRSNQESVGHHLATIFEAIIHQHGEQSDWFGPFARTIKTDRYDDYVNGVDEVIEFVEPQKPSSHLALAIDATFNDNYLGNELKKILNKIDEGKMTEIKYFESSDQTFRGQLSLIPQIILCADEKTIRELADLWVNEPKRLAEHSIQLQNLEEALEQLKFFADYAKKVGQNKIAERYDHAISILSPILQEKLTTIRDIGNKRDAIYHNLMARLEILKGETLR